MNYGDFARLDIPEREWIVEGLLTTQALAMIYGWRGLGKTWLSLSMAVAVGSGEAFLKWDSAQKRRVLYVDGEMPAADLQARARQMVGGREGVLLDLISSEFFYQSERCGFVLNNIEHQGRFLALLAALDAEDRRPAVLIFDNISSMSSGVDENDNSAMDSLLAFMRELRHLGYTVILIHHAGKGGDQRGASRREDLLDVVIRLAQPDTPSRTGNAKFRIEFAKVRGTRAPSTIECELIVGPDGSPAWAMVEVGGTGEKPAWLHVLKFIGEKKPSTQTEIATAFGVGHSVISRHLSRLRKREMVEPKSLTLTKGGQRYLESAFTEGGSDGSEI
jgi:KaiC/GvpD/RAD55 family RecA-like ATPase